MSRREEILVRVEELLAALSGVFSARNRIDIPEAKTPAAVLLDGDESAMEVTHGRGRPPSGPNLMTMTIGLHLLVMKRATTGTDLNDLRDRVLDAILKDAELIALVHNKDIRYEGCQTAFAAGRTMAGEMDLFISLTYVHRV